MVERIREGDIPGVQLRLRVVLPRTSDEVWPLLTDPARAARWLAHRIELEDDLGERLRLESEFEGRELVERAVVEESVPSRRRILSLERLGEEWRAPTRVTFELRQAVEGAELAIVHEGFQRLSLSRCLTIWELYRRRWRWAVDRLGSELGGVDGAPGAPFGVSRPASER